MRGLKSLAESGAEGKWIGALNWATGETVAVKEIQLSNIPKGELGEIMVSFNNSDRLGLIIFIVGDRPAQEFKREIF